jgi:hypothetical protein
VLLHHLSCADCALGNQIHDFPINPASHFLRIGTEVFSVFESDESEPIAHSQFGDDVVGDLIGFFEVISCAVSAGAVKELLSASSAEDEADPVDQLALRVQLILTVEVLRKPQ